MSSFKICCWSIIILGLAFTSCSEEKSENKEYKEYHPAEDNIINPYWAEFTEDAPTRSPDCWNKNVLGKLKIKTIELYAFGGENPDDTLEKKLFSFSNNWRTLEYEDFKFSETPAIWSRGVLRFYEDFEEMDITFSKHFGINRQISTRAFKTDECVILLRKKNSNQFDTTFVYGSLLKPKLVVTKIGKNIYSIDAYMKSTASTSEIKSVFAKMNRNEDEMLFAQRNVVFVENEKPVSSFMLNEDYVQVSQVKQWDYDENQNLIRYQEFIGNSVVRDIEWVYRADLLPESITIDRKKYFCAYK